MAPCVQNDKNRTYCARENYKPCTQKVETRAPASCLRPALATEQVETTLGTWDPVLRKIKCHNRSLFKKKKKNSWKMWMFKYQNVLRLTMFTVAVTQLWAYTIEMVELKWVNYMICELYLSKAIAKEHRHILVNRTARKAYARGNLVKFVKNHTHTNTLLSFMPVLIALRHGLSHLRDLLFTK